MAIRSSTTSLSSLVRRIQVFWTSSSSFHTCSSGHVHSHYPPASLLPPHTLVSGASAGMQLMAVPKRKVSRSRRLKRNSQKGLNPIPVLHKCKFCGRVKLPYFYCCGGSSDQGQ